MKPARSALLRGLLLSAYLLPAFAIFLLSVAALHSAHAQPPASAPSVLKLTLHDTIQPITAGYLERGLAHAAEIHADAVLVSLGTPGGLLDSTREMVSAIEASPVPVIIFIEPSGSRAGSAGFFLLEASDIAAMAPGTNTGAAHPIVEGTTMDPVLKLKIENDAAAFLRSYIGIHSRNATAAEDAIRNSKSYSATESLDLKLIDLIAPDDQALLRALDGRSIHRFSGAIQTLHLAGATILPEPPSTRERLLSRLASPDLAVLLIVLGSLLIYLEFNVPGTIVPGALGTLLLLLGIFGLNLLPVRHTSVLLLFFALALMVFEAKFPSHGILALAGVLCLVFGLATLVDGPIVEMRVQLGTAIGAGVGFGAVTSVLAWIALRARRSKRLLGPQVMLGGNAVALTPLAPSGQVEIRGEIWQARLLNSASAQPAGAALTVRSIDGLILIVEA